MYQLESFWSEQTPQYQKDTKRFENNIMEASHASKMHAIAKSGEYKAKKGGSARRGKGEHH